MRGPLAQAVICLSQYSSLRVKGFLIECGNLFTGPIQHSYPKVMTGGEQTIKKVCNSCLARIPVYKYQILQAFLNLGVRATPDPVGFDGLQSAAPELI